MDNNYEDIVRDWYNRLRPDFLRSLCGKFPALTLGDAENLYQDTFLAIYENLKEGRIKDNTIWRNYILTIGLNLANKEMRKVGITDSYDGDVENEDDEMPSRIVRKVTDILKELPEEETPLYKNLDAQALLGKELSHTPNPCQSIIRLFYYYNQDMGQIATAVGMKNAATAKSKKSQCMKDLVQRVKKSLLDAGIID